MKGHELARKLLAMEDYTVNITVLNVGDNIEDFREFDIIEDDISDLIDIVVEKVKN